MSFKKILYTIFAGDVVLFWKICINKITTGINKISSVLKNFHFQKKGKMKLNLVDKREIIIPMISCVFYLADIVLLHLK